MKKNHPLRIIPLGGLGEIGKNMMVYQYGEEYLVVDAGLMFPENDMLGVDYLIPDIQFLRERRQKIRGIVITHGHEDHIGSIQHFLEDIQVPIYATPLTRGLLEVKLTRHGLLSKVELVTVQAGEVVQIGPFRVEFFHVCHSIPDCVGIGIQTPAGLIVHSGDYKFDHTPVDGWPTDYAKLAEFSRRGVLALLANSTNSESSGWTPSEMVVGEALDHVFREAKGRIIIASFASLISRIQQVADVAERHGRKLAFVGPSMVDNVKIARKLGYLNIGDSQVINIEQARNAPDAEVVVMCTGAQGEPTSILGRLSVGAYRQFEIKQGDTVILSSRPIPGNEENIHRTINRLFQNGANVLYEAIAPVHVSGHANQEEIKLLLNLVRPKYVIPIHGELRHLKQHARLAEQVGIPAENIAVIENGQVIEFVDGAMRLAERVPASYMFVDGSSVGDVDSDVVRQRELLSRGGMVLISVVLNKEDGRLLTLPGVVSKGFILENESEDIFNQVRQRVAETVKISTNGDLQKNIEQAARNFLYEETHRRPMVFVIISQI